MSPSASTLVSTIGEYVVPVSSELFLDSDEVERLHDFEEECMDSYFREKDQLLQNSTNERIRSTAQW